MTARQEKDDATRTVASLLSILLLTFHLSDDIVRGIEPGQLSTIVGVLILVVWLYGTLVLGGRFLRHPFGACAVERRAGPGRVSS